MSSIQKKIKQAAIDYLTACEIDDDLLVVDAEIRTEIELPCIAVKVESMEPHSSALSMVHRAEVSLTLRSHPGDDTEDTFNGWADLIESALHDKSTVSAIFSDAGLTVYEWLYAGATTEWDESTVEQTFRASVLCQRTG